MKIESLNELKKLFKLCREAGIDAMEVDNIKISFGPAPVYSNVKQTVRLPSQTALAPGGITDETKIEIGGGLTEEQLMFYSVGGMPIDANAEEPKQ